MENLKTIWILSGAPGSGKSTWVHKNYLPNSLIISRDQIRFNMLKDFLMLLEIRSLIIFIWMLLI